MMPGPPDHQRVRALFSAVLDLTPEQRAARLAEACADAPELRAEVEDLLRHHAATGQPLADEQAGHVLADLTPPATDLPDRVGPYRIVRRIGQGGMGVVYLAEQADPRRSVALKVMRTGKLAPDLRARFRREVRLLGQLRHPGIVPIYEAGEVELDGQACAYFAMEYVDGAALNDYVEHARLDRRQRLELLAQVCDAVQHAHDQDIIHRDLKPANIVVDAAGRARVLDFGVARMTQSDQHTLTVETSVGQLIGTLQYMSPEQISGATDALDPRSDVYALGVIGYELLAGRLPYDLDDRSLAQIARTVQETEPTRLGTLDTNLRGEVETILLKALEKDRARRYASVADFAADIRRYLRHEPIHARPATTLYQLRKFAQRNTALVAGVAVAMLALLVGFVVSTTLYLRADEARTRAESQQRRAEREAARFAAINAFLINDLLAAPNPWEAGGRSMTVAEVLDDAADGIAERFADAPDVECAIRTALGDSYRALGLFADARPQYERALALLDTLAAPDPALRRAALRGQATNLKELGAYEQAEALARTALAEVSQTHGDDSLQAARALETLGSVRARQGRYDEAEAALRRVLSLLHRHEADPLARARATNELGSALFWATRHDEAMELKRAALEILQGELGPEHPYVAQTLYDLGSTYWELRQYEPSEQHLRAALPLLERHLGARHPVVLAARRSLGNTLSFLDRDDEAEPLLRQVIADSRTALGHGHPDTMAALNSLATLLLRAERIAEAAPLFEELIALAEESLDPQHPDVLKYAINLGWCRARAQDDASAEPLFRRAAEGLEATVGLAHADTQRALDPLAQLLQRAGRFEQEAACLEKLLEGRRAAGAPQDLGHALFLHRYGSALMKAGDYRAACPPLEACVAICQEGFPPEDWRTALARSKLGECLSRSGQHARAEAHLLAARAAHETVPQPAEHRARTITRLIEHYERSNQPDRATALRAAVDAEADAGAEAEADDQIP